MPKGWRPAAATRTRKKANCSSTMSKAAFFLEVQQELSRNKRLAGEIVQDLLIANFPETIHQDILDAVGIKLSPGARVIIARSPEFHERVCE